MTQSKLAYTNTFKLTNGRIRRFPISWAASNGPTIIPVTHQWDKISISQNGATPGLKVAVLTY